MSLGSYFLLKWAHLMLFGFAIGGAVGRGLATRFGEQRWKVLSLQLQRSCIVFLLPVGYLLGLYSGFVRLPAPFMVGLGVVSLAWAWLVSRTPEDAEGPTARRWRQIELGWCVVLSAGLVWDAFQGLRGTGHIFADWIALKFLMLALLIVVTAFARARPLLQSVASVGLLAALAWVSLVRPEL